MLVFIKIIISLEENPDSSIYELDLTREQYGNVGKRNILLSSLSGLTYHTNLIIQLNIVALVIPLKVIFFYKEHRK